MSLLKCRIAYNKYGGYCLPEAALHRPAVQRVLAGEVWEADTIEFMVANCGAGDIVHAGAFFGDFLPALSRGLVPGALIWAFEPNPENYRCARITLELNDLENVELKHGGLGSRREVLPLQVSDERGRALGGASRIAEGPAGDNIRIEKAEIYRIDETVPRDRPVSIIQLDVEGHEEAVLRGALETIRLHKPVLILEARPGSTWLQGEWLEENLLPLQYAHTGRLQNNIVLACERY